MTDYSLFIRSCPPAASDAELAQPGLHAPIVQRLSLHGERCGPYGLQAWAEARGLPLHYVNNVWVRARVRGRDLPAFFAEVLGGEASPSPDIEPDAAYLIEADEY